MKKAYDTMKIQKIGNSIAVFIPKRIADFLELDKGDEVSLDAETGKYGKFMSLWKKKE